MTQITATRQFSLAKSAIGNWQSAMLKLSGLTFLLFALLVLPASVRGQSDPDPDDVVRVDTDLTSLLFTATDKRNRFITTLSRDDVRVLEDGIAQEIFTFQQETDRPLSLAFLIDVSVSQQRTLPLEKAAARTFIETVVRSRQDEVAIIPFTGSAYLEQPMTSRVLEVLLALQRVEPALPSYLGRGRPIGGIASGPGMKAVPTEGSTAIWDAVAVTSSEVLAASASPRRRAIILLTDGHDSSSRVSSTIAVDRVLAAEAAVYVIGIGDSKFEGVDKGALRSLAERTGGRAFFPKKEDDLRAAFAEIELELRTQYLVAYSPTNKKRDGAYRQTTIEVTNPRWQQEKLKLRHRPGYFASGR